MTPEFMGSADGDMGEPFSSLYDPTADPNRDSNGGNRQDRAALPPTHVRRTLPPSGRRPADVPPGEFDWSDAPNNPARAGPVFLPSDRALLDPAYGVSEAYEMLFLNVKPAHGWAHRYLGGDIATVDGHFAFRDPFAFLLHSNVDRLYASWQLRRVSDSRDVEWRLDPAQVYGDKRTDLDMARPMNPWSGGSLGISPWNVPGAPAVHTTDPEVVRPTMYDRYVYDDELCASWVVLLQGRKLPGGNIVSATIELDVAPPGSTDVRLVLGSNCGWWKGVRIPLAGQDSVMIEVDADTRQAETSVPTAGLEGGVLILHRREWVFWPFRTDKRIAFRIADLGILPDRSRVTFVWERE